MTMSTLLDGLRPDGAAVFVRSLLAATLLSLMPSGIIWWPDRREWGHRPSSGKGVQQWINGEAAQAIRRPVMIVSLPRKLVP